MKLPSIAIVYLAAALFLFPRANAPAQQLPPGVKHNDTEMLAKCKERLYMNPGLFFYVCRNGIGARVLRCTKVEQKKNPDGNHPTRKPLVRDFRVELHEGQLSKAGSKRLAEMCRAHNKLAPTQKIVQRAAPPPKKKKEPTRRGVKKRGGGKPSALRVALLPLGPDKTIPGERFSSHQKRLLRTVCAPYESGGKTIVPESSKDDLEFLLSLTQSKDNASRKAAILTCIMRECNSPYQAEAKYHNLDRNTEPALRMRSVALDALRTEAVEFSFEFDQLRLIDNDDKVKRGLINQILENEHKALRDFGEILDDIIFTQAFRDYNARQARVLTFGTAVAVSRRLIEKVAATSSVGMESSYPALRVKLIREKNHMATLQISNQTRATQRNVLITTRSIADPELVAHTAKSLVLQRELANAFGLFSQGTDAEMPVGIDLWKRIQKIDFGSVIYLPELSPSAVINVTLCSVDRLRMTKDVRVSFWSDNVVSRDIKAYNLSQELKELHAPAQPGLVFDPTTLTWKPQPSKAKPKRKTREQLRREQAVKARNTRIATESVARAKIHIKNGNTLAARIQLEQAVRIAPDSSAAKQAKALLKKIVE